MVHLLSRGYVLPVVSYMRKCLEKLNTDISLIRYFVTEVTAAYGNLVYVCALSCQVCSPVVCPISALRRLMLTVSIPLLVSDVFTRGVGICQKKPGMNI